MTYGLLQILEGAKKIITYFNIIVYIAFSKGAHCPFYLVNPSYLYCYVEVVLSNKFFESLFISFFFTTFINILVLTLIYHRHHDCHLMLRKSQAYGGLALNLHGC